MYKIGEYVVYKKDVCKVKAIKKNHPNDKDYYVLIPIDDESLIIDVPVENRCGYIRDLINKEKVEEIINSIPSVPVIKCDTKNIENEYKNLLSTGEHLDLIKIIKTTYLRNQERTMNKRKSGDKDDFYFRKAEKYLYNEFSLVLGMNFDEVKKYIIDKVVLMENNNEK